MQLSQKLFQASAWLRYWLEAVNEHSLHAPFVYQLYREVIRPQGPSLPAVEQLRRELLESGEWLQLQEMGAGSSLTTNNKRPVASIARHSLTPARFSQLLYRLLQFTQAQTVLELGTSLGLNSLYMAAAIPAGTLYTIEGCPQTAALARRHVELQQVTNIQLLTGNIDQQLPQLLAQASPQLDLAYLDANHTYEATLRYFGWLLPHLHPQSVVVVDDIHWSAGMQQAWQELCRHPSVTLSLDLYEAGLLFFRPGMQAQQYVLEY
ncbi:O-methyltransferase [Cesiribacter andamanensis]|uniref:Putative O-methyltransferase n=1 Tax=Cesiribacter andamanensis AMV16 TaxID=1279009 RepID=M7NUF4_9BACT|nr:class I SAM-dependent methyltransferase [Cesiribacter andamanensis]EMR02119.1 putative O-methyltransferase [Cesiribacter andamanensis AMV16]